MVDSTVDVATEDGRDFPEKVPDCESDGLNVSEFHGPIPGNHDRRGGVVSRTIWGETEVTTGGSLMARVVVIGGLLAGSGRGLMVVVGALFIGAGVGFFTGRALTAVLVGVGGFFPGAGCFLMVVVDTFLTGAGVGFFTGCGVLTAVLGEVEGFFTGAGCFLMVVGVDFHPGFGAGLTGVDFHPGFGGGFIPFGISTISPVAFLYFSAPADPCHNTNTRIPTISPKMENIVTLAKRSSRKVF